MQFDNLSSLMTASQNDISLNKHIISNIKILETFMIFYMYMRSIEN